MSARTRRAPLAVTMVAALTASLGLTGCGDSDETSTPTSATTSSSASSSTGSARPTTSAATTTATTAPSTPSSAAPSSSTTGAAESSAADTSTSRAPAPSSTSSSPTATSTAGGGKQVTSGTPVRLTMPSLGFDQPVRAMGLNNGAIDPPPHVVQWYTGSVRPGSPGISVIAAHVAPYGGRAGIFSTLPRMSVGDTVDLGYAGGGKRTFRVYAKEAVGKKELQRDPRVWGSSSTPVVALITCDAAAEHVGGHSTKNYVVWVKPV